VTVHWGRELQLVPLDRDVESAKAMIDAGADTIFGHHPHRLQALEFHDGKPIAWSLGNSFWPRPVGGRRHRPQLRRWAGRYRSEMAQPSGSRAHEMTDEGNVVGAVGAQPLRHLGPDGPAQPGDRGVVGGLAER